MSAGTKRRAAGRRLEQGLRHLGGYWGPVEFARLSNGLGVIALVDRDSPVCEVQTWFSVGSADDPAGKTGLAHLFEHLMFRRTRMREEGEFDRLLEEQGAFCNAATWLDWTSYREGLPQEALELVLELEAERMSGLLLDRATVLTERDIVLNERRQCVDNDPDGMISEKVFSLFFQGHPYQHPVIGYEEDIGALSLTDCRQFYTRHYNPASAVVVVVGPRPADEVLRLVEGSHGGISRSAPEVGLLQAFPGPSARHDETMLLPLVCPKLAVAFAGPASSEDDVVVMRLVAELLAGAESCPLVHSLVDERALCISMDAFSSAMKAGGLFQFEFEPSPELPVAAEDQILGLLGDELSRLGRELPDAEFQAARNRMQMSMLRSSIGVSGKCSLLGEYQVTDGDFRSLFRFQEQLEALTPADVSAAIRRTLCRVPDVIVRARPMNGGGR